VSHLAIDSGFQNTARKFSELFLKSSGVILNIFCLAHSPYTRKEGDRCQSPSCVCQHIYSTIIYHSQGFQPLRGYTLLVRENPDNGNLILPTYFFLFSNLSPMVRPLAVAAISTPDSRLFIHHKTVFACRMTL
jgi:hypothetical protein